MTKCKVDLVVALGLAAIVAMQGIDGRPFSFGAGLAGCACLVASSIMCMRRHPDADKTAAAAAGKWTGVTGWALLSVSAALRVLDTPQEALASVAYAAVAMSRAGLPYVGFGAPVALAGYHYFNARDAFADGDTLMGTVSVLLFLIYIAYVLTLIVLFMLKKKKKTAPTTTTTTTTTTTAAPTTPPTTTT